MVKRLAAVPRIGYRAATHLRRNVMTPETQLIVLAGCALILNACTIVLAWSAMTLVRSNRILDEQPWRRKDRG